MKKKMIAGASVIALLAAGLTFSPQIHQWLDERAKVRAIQERYDRALKTAVSYQDSNPAGSSKLTDWIFDIADPRTAPMAQWDNPGETPQMITQQWFAEDRKKAGLYTMNLDGTNLKVLLTPDEVNGSVSWIKSLRPKRSPNGRYVFFNSGLFSQQKGCVLADLKTRQIERFDGDCLFGGWLPDSSKAYVAQLSKAYEIDTSAMKMTELPLALPNPDTPQVRKVWLDGNEHRFDKVDRVRLVNNGTQLLVDVKTKHNMASLNRAAKPTYLSYQLDDWQNYQQANFYPQECDREKYIYWREDNGAFSCKTKQGYRAYNAYDMSQSDLMADGALYPLQIGVVNGKETLIPRFTRARQVNEKSPIDTLQYYYQLANPRDRVKGFSLYIPPSLSQDFNQYDLVKELPALPSHSQYKAAFDEHYQEQLEKCEQYWQANNEGHWNQSDDYVCSNLCKIARLGSHFISTDCKSTQKATRR